MRLLVTAEMPPDDKVLNYSFRLGVNYRQQPGDFDSSDYCNQAGVIHAGSEVRFDCGVDCEGAASASRRPRTRRPRTTDR